MNELVVRSRGLLARLAAPPTMPECGSLEEEALALREVQARSGFVAHLATWAAGAVFFAVVNAMSGDTMPWFVFPVGGWAIGLVTHGVAALVVKPQEYAEKRQRLARERMRSAPPPEPASTPPEPTGVAALRTKLIGAAEEARAALRTVSAQAAADVSRGETRALEMVAWLDDADRVVRRQDSERTLRREVARKLSDPAYRSAREPLQRLLGKLDREDEEIAELERALADRRARMDSFLLALDGVRLARACGRPLPAISAPFSERVALLEEVCEAPQVPAAAVVEADPARIAEEVRLARELQQSILPARAPEVRGLSVSHVYRPSSEVGGDFYDFYPLGEGRLLCALGDASGHGIDSSMVSSMCKSALYMQVSAGREIHVALAEINRMMCDTLGRRRLMTMMLLDIDVPAGRLLMVNAGQIFPLLVGGGGDVCEIEQPGYPLGVRRDASYVPREARIGRGDRLVLLTDGFVEALSASGEAYGWDRLRGALARSPRSSEQLLTALVSELSAHLGSTPPQDDVTIVAMEVTG